MLVPGTPFRVGAIAWDYNIGFVATSTLIVPGAGVDTTRLVFHFSVAGWAVPGTDFWGDGDFVGTLTFWIICLFMFSLCE